MSTTELQERTHAAIQHEEHQAACKTATDLMVLSQPASRPAGPNVADPAHATGQDIRKLRRPSISVKLSQAAEPSAIKVCHQPYCSPIAADQQLDADLHIRD